jgi:hypothetical protein
MNLEACCFKRSIIVFIYGFKKYEDSSLQDEHVMTNVKAVGYETNLQDKNNMNSY